MPPASSARAEASVAALPGAWMRTPPMPGCPGISQQLTPGCPARLPSRLAYVVSFSSFVDLITFLPMLILTHFDVRSLATACFRMLRIARIFK